jgi:hypothetical protein
LEHATRKQQVYLANIRKQKKMEKHKALARKYHLQALEINAKKVLSQQQMQDKSKIVA